MHAGELRDDLEAHDEDVDSDEGRLEVALGAGQVDEDEWRHHEELLGGRPGHAGLDLLPEGQALVGPEVLGREDTVSRALAEVQVEARDL